MTDDKNGGAQAPAAATPSAAAETADMVAVIRVLEYIGPRHWVESTLEKSHVRGDYFPGPNRIIRERCVGQPQQLVLKTK